MGIRGDLVTHTSDYFQELYDQAIAIIKSGNAYADDTPQLQVRIHSAVARSLRPFLVDA